MVNGYYAKKGSCVAAAGSTTRRTCARLGATTTSPAIVTTTLAFVFPELICVGWRRVTKRLSGCRFWQCAKAYTKSKAPDMLVGESSSLAEGLSVSRFFVKLFRLYFTHV